MNAEANLPDTSVEVISMQLLQDLQHELEKALNSLGGTPKRAIQHSYYFYAAVHMNRIVHGFLFLRQHGYADAAKFLLRPAIESMIRIQAARKQPDLVYRIIYTETLEDDKWIAPAARRLGQSYTTRRDSKDWHEFKDLCISEFGRENLVDCELSLYTAAQIAGIESYYDTHYRMYCRYTHGGLEAMSGELDSLSDPEDSRTLVCCAFAALMAICSIGADCTNLDSLRERVTNLSTRKPDPLRRIRQEADQFASNPPTGD
jgi:hypothetical protein